MNCDRYPGIGAAIFRGPQMDSLLVKDRNTHIDPGGVCIKALDIYGHLQRLA